MIGSNIKILNFHLIKHRISIIDLIQFLAAILFIPIVWWNCAIYLVYAPFIFYFDLLQYVLYIMAFCGLALIFFWVFSHYSPIFIAVMLELFIHFCTLELIKQQVLIFNYFFTVICNELRNTYILLMIIVSLFFFLFVIIEVVGLLILSSMPQSISV